jgi:hypothetical protein
MLDLINATLTLKETDPKASFFIAKELAIIQVNVVWYPDKIGAQATRLRSLAQHVLITFKHNDDAKLLASRIKFKALDLDNNA